MPEGLAELAKLREQNPDESLSTLAQLMNISKSGVNHRMRKLMEIAEEYK